MHKSLHTEALSYLCLSHTHIYIYILVNPLPGVETNSYLVNWLTGYLVAWLGYPVNLFTG